ncbi:MAG: hypothetical protein RMJ36_05725, partial [Candidatus Calescibacterium sp.]|nr:hypothetical protein [Candidatus Calescibacterium sp.]MDW8133135.1 hypothetical protein [Candidatus Calescibacterium sp.]
MEKKSIRGRFSKEEIKKEEVLDKKEEILDLIKQSKKSGKLSKKQQEEIDSLSKGYIRGGGKISIKDLAMVTNQWAIMMEAGLDLKKSMFILFNQTE